MQMVLHDREGTAVAYCDDGVNIFLFSGQPVAYMNADAVYSYKGEQLGWYDLGWLRDKDGRCIAFSTDAGAGAQKPPRRPEPYRATKQPLPTLERRDPRVLHPMHSNAWALRSATEFFARSPLRWPGNLGDSVGGK
jgi:hypothetical protein